MIDKTFIPVGGLKKEPYSGCHNGMRYFLQADEQKLNFIATVYPEPWSFEKTDPKNKISSTFPISEEGMDNAIAWLFHMYEEKKDFWNDSLKNAMHIAFKN